jgi:Uma2 family endonuclease
MIVPTVTMPDTFAELHRRIGEVPLDRIRMKPPPGSATEQDVIDALEAADKRLYELIDGVLVEKTVGSKEALLSGFIFGRLWEFVGESGPGLLLPGDGPVRLIPGNVRLPDVSYIPWESFPGGEVPEEKIWSVTPAFVVEVLSESNTKAEIFRKLHDLFTTGCKLAWIIDPVTQTAKVHTSLTKARTVGQGGVLFGGSVLPGFKLPLADMFAVTRRRKKKPR